MANRMRPFHDVMASPVIPSQRPKTSNTNDEDGDEVEEVLEFTTPHTIITTANVCFVPKNNTKQDVHPPWYWYSIACRVLLFCPVTIPSALAKYVYKKCKPHLDQVRQYYKEKYENKDRFMIAAIRKNYVVLSKRELERREAKEGAIKGEEEEEEPSPRQGDNISHGLLRKFKSIRIAATRPRTTDQAQSRLLQLPLDIKMLIFDLLLPSSKAVHIVLSGNRIRSLQCDHPHQNWGEGCYCRCRKGTKINSKYTWAFQKTTGLHNLTLLLTICRSMNSDVSTHVYRTKTFKFHSPATLLLFDASNPSALEKMTSIYIDGRQDGDFALPLMFLSKPLRRRYKNARPLPNPINLAVHHLPSSRTKGAPVASAWGAACMRLSELPNLTSLRVHLSKKTFAGLGRAIINSDTWCDDEVDKFVLEPLSEVQEQLGRQLQTLEVVLDWQGERGVKDARNCRKRWGFAVKRVRVVGKRAGVDV